MGEAEESARVSESLFRTSVPRHVAGAEVMEVLNYRPGRAADPKPANYGPAYAAAIAVCKWGDHEWSSHIIVHADDRPEDEPDRWYLSAGTYFETRVKVNKHARARHP
jgi:hypothetical protein